MLEEHPQHWKLTFTNDKSSDHEELVVRMQGIITRKDLPPVTRRYAVAGGYEWLTYRLET
jgi:hypothetical protein